MVEAAGIEPASLNQCQQLLQFIPTRQGPALQHFVDIPFIGGQHPTSYLAATRVEQSASIAVPNARPLGRDSVVNLFSELSPREDRVSFSEAHGLKVFERFVNNSISVV